ncbi:MAG: dihydroorotate dehydrogenase electron transfer subunit [Candidatus Omnitrophota bacterium]
MPERNDIKKISMVGSAPIVQLEARVIRQVKVAQETFLLSLEAPPITRRIQPGQFVQVRCRAQEDARGQFYDPFLPRPFSVHRLRGRRILEILYEVVGCGTRWMSELRQGDSLHLFGPLGNTFSYPAAGSLSFLVGGGGGIAPFYDLAEALIDPGRGKQRKQDVIVLFGARTRKKVLCEKEFKTLGVRFEAATEDGSYGFKGFVTELLEKRLRATSDKQQATRIYACGPNPMLRAVYGIAKAFHIPCEVSLHTHMPCGYGVCFGCAVKTKIQDNQTNNAALSRGVTRPRAPKFASSDSDAEFGKRSRQDPEAERGAQTAYKLVCTDGPVFRAEELIWDP